MRSTRVLPIVVALVAWLAVVSIGAPPASAVDPPLYAQTTGDSGTGITITDSPTDQYDAEGAADFVVPPSTTWNLSSVVATVVDLTGGDVNSIRVRIYADAAGTPGSVLFDQTDASTGNGAPADETITLNPVISLSSGTYWLSLQANAPNFQFYWETTSITTGAAGMWRNPNNGFGYGCTSFAPTTSCFTVAPVNDWLFQLLGTTGGGAGTCNGLTPTITGSGTITGTSGPDVILGSSGPDSITGGGGADTICAGDGDDVVHGGAGGDRIDGGAGNDQVYGQGGDDVLAGNGGDDTVKGQDGNDQISGGQGSDTLAGGIGDDFLSGGDGKDHIFGGDGSDKANGSEGNDVMFGGAGNDDLHGNAGNDSMDGGTGTDTCKGGGGTDTLTECDN
jgi:Ca2+-binding RTX toxin-like protein